MALIDFGSVKDLPIVWQVMICIAAYGLLNICIYIFRTIKVRGIKKSSFSDLRESSNRKKEIVVQYDERQRVHGGENGETLLGERCDTPG